MIQSGVSRRPVFQVVTSVDLTKSEKGDLAQLRSDLESLEFLLTLEVNGGQIIDGRLEGLKRIRLMNLLLYDVNDDELNQLPRFKKDLYCLHITSPKNYRRRNETGR